MNQITQAFVLAAGLGNRLRPLTDELPKPLIPIFQKPLITFALDHLIAAGVQSFVINTHRLPNLFHEFFSGNGYHGHSVTLAHEPDLLETGGGIKNVESILRKEQENFDYANISVWNPEIFGRIPATRKISFIPILIDWINHGGTIGGLAVDDGKWFNIGSRAQYLEVHRKILRDDWKPYYVKVRDWPERIAKSAAVDVSAELRGCSVVGGDCRVGAEVILEDTILWPGAQIASQSHLQGCIVRSQKKASGIHRNIDI